MQTDMRYPRLIQSYKNRVNSSVEQVLKTCRQILLRRWTPPRKFLHIPMYESTDKIVLGIVARELTESGWNVTYIKAGAFTIARIAIQRLSRMDRLRSRLFPFRYI